MIVALVVACAPKVDRGPTLQVKLNAPVPIVALPGDDDRVRIQAMVRAGSASDPPGDEGLAALTLRSLTVGGAGAWSAAEVEERLQAEDSTLERVVDREWAAIRLDCPVASTEFCSELMGALLTRPRFEARAIERSWTEALGALRTTDPVSVAAQGLTALLFEAHPYGHAVDGRFGTLPTLDRDDIQRYFTRHYVRRAIWLGTSGAVDLPWLDQIPARRAPELPLPAPLQPKRSTLVLLDTDTDRTVFAVGQATTVDRGHPDWPALQVLSAVLSQRGSVPTLGSALGPAPIAMPMPRRHRILGVLVEIESPEYGVRQLNRMLAIFRAVRRDGITETELADARAELLDPHPDAVTRLEDAMDAAALDLPNRRDLLDVALSALTIEAVNEAATRHLRPDALSMVGVTRVTTEDLQTSDVHGNMPLTVPVWTRAIQGLAPGDVFVHDAIATQR